MLYIIIRYSLVFILIYLFVLSNQYCLFWHKLFYFKDLKIDPVNLFFCAQNIKQDYILQKGVFRNLNFYKRIKR